MTPSIRSPMIVGTDSGFHRPIRGRGHRRFMPLKSTRTRYSPWWFFALIMVLFGALLQLSMSKLNPDWFSYQLIYESKGAWLSDQGRDPVFLILTAYLAKLFGPQGYEASRIFLAFYFLLFVALLSSGCIFKLNRTKGAYVFLMVALVYLGFTRFTIQIREGLAMTPVVLSLALVL